MYTNYCENKRNLLIRTHARQKKLLKERFLIFCNVDYFQRGNFPKGNDKIDYLELPRLTVFALEVWF